MDLPAYSLSIGRGLSHSVSEWYIVCFIFWFPYSIRNVLKNFQNFSQPDRPVGELDQPFFRVL